MHRFDGKTDDERKVWHSYMRIARDRVIASGAVPSATRRPEICNQKLVWDKKAREAVQTIVFAAFILEARLKRVLNEMGRPPRKLDGLNNVLTNFWRALSTVKKIGREDACAPPPEWSQIEAQLNELRQLRNLMAHGNLSEVARRLRSQDAQKKARELYNAVMKAILLVNLGTGYETKSPKDAWQYFAPLLMLD
jgi:hypothetical protein